VWVCGVGVNGKRTLCVGIQHFYHAQLIAGHRSTNWQPRDGNRIRIKSVCQPKKGRRTKDEQPRAAQQGASRSCQLCVCVCVLVCEYVYATTNT